jgi:hypothetical protein
VVVILDGIDHMTLASDVLPDGKSQGGANQSSSEGDDSGGDEEEEKEAKKNDEGPPKKQPEEEMPVIYNCPACTFENPVTVSECEVCGTGRPPMEVIISDFRAANQPPEESKKPSDPAKGGDGDSAIVTEAKKTLV